MTPEKWQETKEKIREKFKVLDEYQEKDEERHEEKEVIIFEGIPGQVRLEFIKRPVILEKKTSYSRRIGGKVEVDYLYSDTEFTHALRTYIYNEQINDWQELKAHSFEL